MARDFGQVKLSIWNDDDFLDLTPGAQHLYIVLLSSPGLSWVGVNDWHPGRLASRAKGWTKQEVIAAAGELVRSRFIVIDPDTDEVLVRSFVRNDGFMKQPNLATSMARAFSVVGSRLLQGVIVHELQRLKREQPDIAGWRSEEARVVVGKRAIDPHDHPSYDPSVDPSIDPQIDPSVEGERHPSVDPSIDPSPTTATTTTTFREGGKVGVGGGPGEEGEDRIDGAEGGNTASAPSPSLDELAAAHAAQPTPPGVCAKHPDGNPTGEACGGCREARLWREAQAEEAAAALRRAIDACDMCDDRGLVDTTDSAGRPVAVKCDHTTPPARPTATHTAFQPTSDPNTRKALFNALNERTVPQPPF